MFSNSSVERGKRDTARSEERNESDEDEDEDDESPEYDERVFYVSELEYYYEGEVAQRWGSTKPFRSEMAKLKPLPLGKRRRHVIEQITSKKANVTNFDSIEHKEAAFRSSENMRSGIRIISPMARHALNAVVTYYPGFAVNELTVFTYPYRVIVHHLPELKDFKTTQSSIETAEDVEVRNRHIDRLISAATVSFSKDIEEEEARHLRDPPVVTFKYYWLLLKPGTTVYWRIHDVWSSWVIKSVKGGFEGGQNKP